MSKIRLFILLTIIIFSFQTLAKADDINEIQIEGMSIGDSLLNYFSKVEIETNNIDKTKNRKFERILILNNKSGLANKYKSIKANLETYDGMHIYIKSNDKNFIIYGIEGMLDFENDISGCRVKQNKIIRDVSNLFKNAEKDTTITPHSGDKTGESKIYRTSIAIDPKSKYYELELACYDWANKIDHIDHFRISIISDPVNDMLEDFYN